MSQEPEFKDWQQVVRRCPVKIVKEISNMIGMFSLIYSLFCIEKCSPLHMAVECGNLMLSEHIIGRIEDKNPKGEFGETPLHWAAKAGDYDISKLILENISDKNPKDDEVRKAEGNHPCRSPRKLPNRRPKWFVEDLVQDWYFLAHLLLRSPNFRSYWPWRRNH